MAFVCNLNFNGIVVPIITPIDKNENINEEKLREQINFVIDGGVHGILAYGSNGEFYMLDDDEMIDAFKIMVDEVKGRVPLYFGIGAIRTKKCVKLAKIAEELGADGISVIQPMFVRPNEEELYTHFMSIAKSVPNLPMLLYNNPGKIGYPMSTNLVYRLAKDAPNIVGMKDSSGDITVLQEFIRVTKDFEFSVLGGKDTLIYATLAMGGCGAVCSTANIWPEFITGIYNKFVEGDTIGSLEDQYRLNPVRLAMDKATFPSATKDMANLVGRDVGDSIKPNLCTKQEVLDYMKNEMKKADLL